METQNRKVRVVYFAWVRERIGLPDEYLSLPDHVRTAGELIAWLTERGDTSCITSLSLSFILTLTTKFRFPAEPVAIQHRIWSDPEMISIRLRQTLHNPGQHALQLCAH